MQRISVHEPIRVRRSAGSLPQRFTWRGRQYQVRKIDGVKEQRLEREDGSIKRTIYQVQTRSGLHCSLAYDEWSNRWRLETVSSKGVGNEYRYALV